MEILNTWTPEALSFLGKKQEIGHSIITVKFFFPKDAKVIFKNAWVQRIIIAPVFKGPFKSHPL